jgi:SP family myo-inositol transporter-like MFS transporter 13
MLPIRRSFELTAFQQEVVVSSTVLSAFFSSLAGGILNNKCGRRVSILFAAAVFAMGSILLMAAINYPTLVLGRIVVGVGIGVGELEFVGMPLVLPISLLKLSFCIFGAS